MKSKEELSAIKNEVETLNKKLSELSEDALKEVVGGNKEFTILPRDDTEFWHSWNPGYNIFDPNNGLD